MNKAGTPLHDNLGPGSVKGKAKIYHDYSFYQDGSLSERAIALLENGSLVHISDVFANDVIDLEAPVGMGYFAKDILHHVINGTLPEVVLYLKKGEMGLPSFVIDGVEELMQVEQVLREMGFQEGDPLSFGHAVAKCRRHGASV